MHVFRRFSKYLVKYWFHILLVLLCTWLFVAFSSAAYWLGASFLQTLFAGGLETVAEPGKASSINDTLKYWTASLIGGETPLDTLTRAAIAIFVAFLAKNLFSYLQLYFVSFVEQRVIKDLRDQLFTHLLRQDLSFFHDQRRGHLISTVLSDVEVLNQSLNKSFTKAIRDPINALVVLGLLLVISPKLTMVAIIIVPAVGWTVQVLGKRIKKHAVHVQEALARVTGHLQESVGGIRVIKAFVGERFERDRFSNLTKSHFKSSLSREKLRRMVIPLNEVVGVIIISGLLYFGGEQVLIRGTISSEDFIRFLVLLFALLTPILSLTNLTANIRVAEAAGGRVFSLLDTVPGLKEAGIKESDLSFNKSLEIKNVSFKYGAGSPVVLENISLEIIPGDKISIIGKSGSGKSTLLNLLPRFYDPSQGSIQLDGVDIMQVDLNTLRKKFGVVTQQVILFHDTVTANIAYGEMGATESAIKDAAKSAYAHDFISALPEGYDTIVGEQGALLSGGQRQRISIARALLRNPPIVLLDEATSALDAESADEINAALEKLMQGRTVISVSHRLSSAINADKIIVLDKGKIVGIGKHDDLLQDNQVYMTLARQQKIISEDEITATN